MLIDIKQNKIIHALLAQTNLFEFKKELVFSYTGGRTDSSREMQQLEAQKLIMYLNSLDVHAAASENMRRKIIAMAHKLRWEVSPGKIDMEALNTWCVNKSYLHKKLNAYTYNELPKLVSQFQNVYASLLQKINNY